MTYSPQFAQNQPPWPQSWEPPAEAPAWAATTPAAFTPPPAAPLAGPPGTPLPGESGPIVNWLDDQERKVTHPRVVERELLRAGWHPIPAAAETLRYRRRFNEHRLGYSALLVSTGIAALALGTAGHILVSGLDHRINPNGLAMWLSLFAVSLPFAIWAHVWAAAVDRDDPVAVWSESRRTLALALVWGCGLVGIGRLLVYAAQLIGSLVGATWAIHHSIAAGAINVAITVSIALPLGLWAFSFLHRFDAEDPTRPDPRHRTGRPAGN